MREVPITSTVGVEFMSIEASSNTTVEGVPTPSTSIPKLAFKTEYATIKDVHQLPTANAALVESNLGGGQNGYLGLILPPDQYSHISNIAFVCPSEPGITATVPAWTPPREEQFLL